MSTAGAVRTARTTARTAIGRPPPAPRPGLRIVSAPEHLRSRASLVAACIALLGIGLVGLLMLTVSLGRGAYEMGALRRTTTELAEQRQALEEQIAAEQAPQALAARARALGMVPAPNVAMIRGSDGAVLGTPKAAAAAAVRAAPPVAKPSVAPSVNPSVNPAPKPSAGAKPIASVAASPGTQTTRTPKSTAVKSATTKPVTKLPAAKPSPAR